MKNLIRIAAATAIAAGYAASASAQVTTNLPSSGTSDLWLFVSDPGAKDTFAIDTNISVSSLETNGLSATAKANTSVQNDPFNFTSTALSTFISSSTDASSLTYAVEAAQFNASGTDFGANDPTLGSVTVVGSTVNSPITKATGMTFGAVGSWAAGFGGDVSLFPINNGAISWGQTAVWGSGSGANPGSSLTYGAGIDQSGVAIGQSAALYLITGNGSSNGTASYNLGNVTLTNANGVATLANVAPAPVPLPAAVWLFGSGLLGLFGVGRRRAA